MIDLTQPRQQYKHGWRLGQKTGRYFAGLTNSKRTVAEEVDFRFLRLGYPPSSLIVLGFIAGWAARAQAFTLDALYEASESACAEAGVPATWDGNLPPVA